MSSTTIPPAPATWTPESLTDHRITKSLLGYGVIAGPVYVVTALIQAATREGFGITRHPWSQLALGGPGWIQVANLALTGLMIVAFAVGLRRALADGTGAQWAPRLVGVFGATMIVAANFPIDAGAGFPLGAPETTVLSTSGLVHLAAGGVGFVALAVGLLILARRLARDGLRRSATACRIVGPLFLAGFLGLASGALGALGIPVFVVCVIAVFSLLSAVSVQLYRRQPDTCSS